MEKEERQNKIEYHLRNYRVYKKAIVNLKKQLDYIMPSMTASYSHAGNSGTFNLTSSTERCAIDRIESKKALDINESIERYSIILESIDNSLSVLNDIEKKFVEIRYFYEKSIVEVSLELGYSERNVYKIRNRVLDKLLISLDGLFSLGF